MSSAALARYIQVSAAATVVVALGLALWSGAEAPLRQQRAVSGVLAASLQPVEDAAPAAQSPVKEIPRRFRKNPAFQLFHKIDSLVRGA